MEKIFAEFGIRLKELRKEKHLTQAELGDLLGCIDRNVQKMEYGHHNVPGLTLIWLADYFQVSLDYLTGRSDVRETTMPMNHIFPENGTIPMGPFSERLKQLRAEKGKKQTEMAAFIGKGSRHYQKMEYGEVNVPALTLIKLADFFEVSLDYLVGRTDQR